VTAYAAITGVNVVPMDSGRILRNQTVIVSNGMISAIGPASSTKIPPGARRVDGANGRSAGDRRARHPQSATRSQFQRILCA
jgi:hypothetical protein